MPPFAAGGTASNAGNGATAPSGGPAGVAGGGPFGPGAASGGAAALRAAARRNVGGRFAESPAAEIDGTAESTAASTKKHVFFVIDIAQNRDLELAQRVARKLIDLEMAAVTVDMIT